MTIYNRHPRFFSRIRFPNNPKTFKMKKLFLVFATAGALVSCKKEGVSTNSSCTINSASIAGNYRIASIKYKADASSTEVDIFTSLPECQKDDIYELKTDGSIVMNDAGVSCDLPPSPSSGMGWKLESSNTILQLADFNYTIQSFDCSTLVVYQSDIYASGDKTITTYVKVP